MGHSWARFLTHLFRRPGTRTIATRRGSRLGLWLEQLEDRTVPATFIVRTVGDANIVPTLVAGTTDVYNAPTLRGAIELSEKTAPGASGVNTIRFAIGNATETIQVGSTTKGAALPEIKTNPVVIDATPPKNSSGVINPKLANQVIVLDGSKANAGSSGLTISAGGSTVRGLVINGFKRDPNAVQGQEGGNGIVLATKGGNKVEGNFIGTDDKGMTLVGNEGFGVYVNQSPDNTIGGITSVTGARPGNILSGNRAGVEILGAGSTGNKVWGNFIGLDNAGKGAIANTNGVVIDNAPNNRVGGATDKAGNLIDGSGNLISGNTNDGVQITGASAKDNKVQGNRIGTQKDGKKELPNATGVAVRAGANLNLVGGTVPAARNILSGNRIDGILITGADSNSNVVQGNYIGVDVNGTGALANRTGVRINGGASLNQIGGQIGTTGLAKTLTPGTGAANVISGNKGAAIQITGGDRTLIQGNLIGVQVDGKTKQPNLAGVLLETTTNATVGGTSPNVRNVISGNTGTGVLIQGSVTKDDTGKTVMFVDSTLNAVQGNYIGVDFSGTTAVGNGGDGVRIDNASNDTIGGVGAGARNVISNNGGNGVTITGAESVRNIVMGNIIGRSQVDAKGATTAMPNSLDGVHIDTGVLRNTISGNLIASNTGAGIGDLNPALSNLYVQNSINLNGMMGIDVSQIVGMPKVTDVSLPVLKVGPIVNGKFTVTGSLTNSAPNAVITIEYFSNTAADPTTGNGQGAVFLGSTTVQTDGTGKSKQDFSLTVSVNRKDYFGNAVTIATGNFISATATLPKATNGQGPGTSEFSKSVAIPKKVAQGSQTTTTLVSTSTQPSYGQPVTFTATVNTTGSDSTTPTGNVLFEQGGNVIGTGALNGVAGNDQATYTTSTLAVGSDSITAVYVGDGNFNTSTSSVVTETVSKDGTTTTLSANPSTSVHGQSITFTASVAAASPGSGTPTGNVLFEQGGNVIGSGTLTGVAGNDVATFSTSSLGLGSDSITAVYVGDDNFTTSTSNTVAESVSQDGTTTSLAADSSTSVFGQPIVFTASVAAASSGAGMPTGTVAFKVSFGTSIVTLGTDTLGSNGTATFVMDHFVPSTQTIFAVYLGDTNFTTSTSSTITHVINKASTTLDLSSTTTTSTAGQPVDFSTTLSVVSPGNFVVPASGTITFYDTYNGSTTVLSAITLGGSPGMSPAFTAAGTHVVTAVYSGDSYFNGSTSASVTVQVVAAAASHFRLQPIGTTFTQGVPFSMTITALDPYGNVASGYTGAVYFVNSDPLGSAPSGAAFTASDNGVLTVSGFVLESPANETITATDTMNSSITGTVYFTLIT
jgi:hypothetical protein